MEHYSLLELKEIKSIIEERLSLKKAWLESERGHNYEEYCKRELTYYQDQDHEKLRKVTSKINEIVNSI